MPPVSQAQRRWAWANKDKGGQEGAAAKEFAEADPGGKLPARAKKRKSSGEEPSISGELTRRLDKKDRH